MSEAATKDQFADLDSHHIEGIAAHGNTPFRVPLFSHIAGNLYVGGCPVGAVPEQFRFVVCLYPWGMGSYTLHASQVFVQAHLYDSAAMPDSGTVDAIAKAVLGFMAAGPTLVHCQAGLNRSGLVSARALILDGMPPADAIRLLREKRSEAVLCNPAFERWLCGMPVAPKGAW